MGVKTYSQEMESPVAAGRMFKALCLDDHLAPKLMPQQFKSLEFLQGDPMSPGSVRPLNFAEGIPYKYMKQRIDEVDVNNFHYKYTTFEGGVLGNGYECIVVEAKIDVKGNGCAVQFNVHFHPLPGTEINDEDAVVKMSQEKSRILVKTLEEYLLANPQAFA
ncbi:hypothetical protein Ancab_021827 [Ancistrocladus abbreviatus]